MASEKGLLEVMTGRIWPDPGLESQSQEHKRIRVFRLWQDCVADRFGRREAILPSTLAIPKSVFSYAVPVMDKVAGWNEEKTGGIEICGVHVDLHQGRNV